MAICWDITHIRRTSSCIDTPWRYLRSQLNPSWKHKKRWPSVPISKYVLIFLATLFKWLVWLESDSSSFSQMTRMSQVKLVVIFPNDSYDLSQTYGHLSEMLVWLESDSSSFFRYCSTDSVSRLRDNAHDFKPACRWPVVTVTRPTSIQSRVLESYTS